MAEEVGLSWLGGWWTAPKDVPGFTVESVSFPSFTADLSGVLLSLHDPSPGLGGESDSGVGNIELQLIGVDFTDVGESSWDLSVCFGTIMPF